MIPLAGILIVFGAVLGGFVLAGGNPGQLAQPAEVIIITGSAFGAMMAANSPARLWRTALALRRVFRRSSYTTEKYLAILQMLYTVFHYARRKGGQALENAVDDPLGTPVLSRFASAVESPELLEFLCDTLRMTALGTISSFTLDDMLESELTIRRQTASGPVEVLTNLADGLPGFGIVAAVLGVILSMGAMREPPMKMGIRIASALIGTFTGILLAYGVVSPISARLEKIEEAESACFDCLRAGLSSFARGVPASIAVECARRAIPTEVRPDFEAMERACRQAETIRG